MQNRSERDSVGGSIFGENEILIFPMILHVYILT